MISYFSRFERASKSDKFRARDSEPVRKEYILSMKHAIIETGGKQYRVSEGDVIFVEKLAGEAGEAVKFDKVLAVIDEAGSQFGTPYVEGVSVAGTVVRQGREKKIRVYKMKPKKGYRNTKGHRQPYTKVEVGAIG